jgi:hypothetical protein
VGYGKRMRLFWKIYAGFWLAGAVLAGGAIAIALMPAIMVGGAAALLPYFGTFPGGQAPSLAQATAALGVITAIAAIGVFSAIYLTLRLLFRRLPGRDPASLVIPPAE